MSRIAITGIGPVTALGIGKEAVWQALQATPVSALTVRQVIAGECWEEFPLAMVREQNPAVDDICNTRIKALTGQQENRDLLLFALAAKLALNDSGLSYESSANCIGIVMSHENPGFDAYTGQIWTALEAQPKQQNGVLRHIQALYEQVERAGYSTHSFVPLQQLSALLHIHGPALCINNACSSGLFALESAAHWLRAGHAQAMLVVCGDSPRLLPRYLWLKTARACSTDGIMRPFDRERSGFVLGEGAGGILIETLDSAQARGAHVYAEYLSGSFHSDAWKLSTHAPSPHRYQQALLEALKRANITPSDIDMVVPHGAATAITDRYEAEGITHVFGKYPKRPFITALKPYVGHTLAGSSLIELILALIGGEHDTVLPTLNWRSPDPQLGLEPVTSARKCQIKTWVKTATGFGGFNAACVFAQPGAQA